MPDLRLFTYNPFANQIFPQESFTNAAKFERLILATKPDVVNLQEIWNYSATDVVSLMNSIVPLPGGATWHAHKASGNIIASKYPLLMRRGDTIPAAERAQAIALVDLPDSDFPRDLYLMNNHFKCCGGFDPLRQQQADAIVGWLRDAKTAGGIVDLPGNTPIAVLGDLNIVGSLAPLNTLITGNIADNGTYGPDAPPDWDGTHITDSQPSHNTIGPDDYTWRDDSSPFQPGRLDFVLYSDSVLVSANHYVLNTTQMTGADLAASGLEVNDVVLDPSAGRFDHLPLITDFRMKTIQQFGDFSANGVLDCADIDLLLSAIQSGTDNLRYDIDGDAVVDLEDVAYWISDVLQTIPGDANLDRSVDGIDFTIWNNAKFTASTSWCEDNFNFDSAVDGVDFAIWNDFKFMSADGIHVPEADTMGILAMGLLCAVGCVRMCRR